MKFFNSFSKNDLYIACLVIFSIVVTVSFGAWPEIYIFATDSSHSTITRLFEAPVHLSDDVMISLRAGQLLNEMGLPVFNRNDIAQPSTSFLSPYVFALLLKFAPQNIAVLAYALLGLLSVSLTFFVIAQIAKSKINAILIIGLLSLTATNLNFSLNGWDHLFQTLFLILALLILLKQKRGEVALICLSACLALAVLFRPDGLLVAAWK